VQPVQHSAQAVKNTAALGALSGVPFETRARPRQEIAIEVGGHVARRPPVISLEARSVQKTVHAA
jgi:hypothetical protein